MAGQFAEVASYCELGLENGWRKLVVRKVTRDEKPFVDIRIWQKWPGKEEYFHTAKGIFLTESDFYNKFLPAMLEISKTFNLQAVSTDSEVKS